MLKEQDPSAKQHPSEREVDRAVKLSFTLKKGQLGIELRFLMMCR